MVEKTTKLKNDREQPRQAWVLKTKKKVGTEAVQVRSSNPDVDEKGQWDGMARSCQRLGKGLGLDQPISSRLACQRNGGLWAQARSK